MCAIGALYRLDRRLSAFLFLTAERAVNMFSFQRDGDSASPSFETQDLETLGKQPMGNFKPVWELQTRVLLVFIATLGGKPTFSRKAVDGIGRKFSLPLYFSSLSNGLTDSFEVLACVRSLKSQWLACADRNRNIEFWHLAYSVIHGTLMCPGTAGLTESP